MNDPQTNGGLLISVASEFENDFLNRIKEKNTAVAEIGILKNNDGPWLLEIL
jgi:selenophosphate synthase